MGKKLVCFGERRGTRSRQDASIGVHEAGRIRPSSGGSGGHVLSLYPLIWRSLLNRPFFKLHWDGLALRIVLGYALRATSKLRFAFCSGCTRRPCRYLP